MTNFLIGVAFVAVVALGVVTRGRGGLLIEWHVWRGVGVERDLFLRGVRLGFLTVLVFRGSLFERLAAQLDMLRDLQRRAGK